MVNSETYSDTDTAKFEPVLNAIIASLPENAKKRRADFLFFETLVPNALAILFLGQNHAFYISPFNSRRLVQLSMSFDTQYRRQNHTTNDLLYLIDPEICNIPFFHETPADISDMSPTEKSESRVAATKKRIDAMLSAEKKSD